MLFKSIIAATLFTLSATAAPSSNDGEVYYLTDCYGPQTSSGGSYWSHFSASTKGKGPEGMGPIIGGSLHSLQKWEGETVRIAMDGGQSDGIFTSVIKSDARHKHPGAEVGTGSTDRKDREGWKYTCYRGDDSKVLYVQDDAKCKGTYYCIHK